MDEVIDQNLLNGINSFVKKEGTRGFPLSTMRTQREISIDLDVKFLPEAQELKTSVTAHGFIEK